MSSVHSRLTPSLVPQTVKQILIWFNTPPQQTRPLLYTHLVWLICWKRLLKIWGAVLKNCPLKRVLRVPTLCKGAVWGLMRDFPRANQRLQPRVWGFEGLRVWGFEENPMGALTLPCSTVLAPKALSWGDSYSTLPRGFSTIAETTKIMRFTGKWSRRLASLPKFTTNFFSSVIRNFGQFFVKNFGVP